MAYFVAIICVLGIATGQILFKLSATTMHQAGNIFDKRSLIILFFALALYGITTLAWVWVLQKIELGRAYPLMALAFVLVPIGSHFFFGERFNIYYIAGVAIIIIGILLTIKS
ncbi:EamA family transporter [Pseudomonas sp. MWU347]|uniref:EamA family transporter n=1 Tax=unclassified Pseudomonas TaxID=196821 RepID=UPI001B320389|nr:EamA family transporter [Pseudomonas sp. MWU347]